MYSSRDSMLQIGLKTILEQKVTTLICTQDNFGIKLSKSSSPSGLLISMTHRDSNQSHSTGSELSGLERDMALDSSSTRLQILECTDMEDAFKKLITYTPSSMLTTLRTTSSALTDQLLKENRNWKKSLSTGSNLLQEFSMNAFPKGLNMYQMNLTSKEYGIITDNSFSRRKFNKPSEEEI
jgi:hypothetical protein